MAQLISAHNLIAVGYAVLAVLRIREKNIGGAGSPEHPGTA
ncbi:hypothetical protein [Xenorhabdus sp. SGI246]